MKRIYHQYQSWECFNSGMYKTNREITLNKWNELELLAIKLLTNENDFYNSGIKLLNEWKISCEENLTNLNQNRVAYIGQACCCLIYGVPEIITKTAWSKIEPYYQYKANKIAEKIIAIYEKENTKIYKDMGTKLLF